MAGIPRKPGPGRPLKGGQRRLRMSFTLEPKHADWLKDLSEAKKLSTSEFLNQLISRELSRVSTRLQIEVPRQKLREFCVRNQIARLSFFGSVLTAHFSSGPFWIGSDG
jgi:hypothetical protein